MRYIIFLALLLSACGGGGSVTDLINAAFTPDSWIDGLFVPVGTLTGPSVVLPAGHYIFPSGSLLALPAQTVTLAPDSAIYYDYNETTRSFMLVTDPIAGPTTNPLPGFTRLAVMNTDATTVTVSTDYNFTGIITRARTDNSDPFMIPFSIGEPYLVLGNQDAFGTFTSVGRGSAELSGFPAYMLANSSYTGTNNVLVHTSSGALTSGSDNVAVGVSALRYTTVGINNVAIGTYALQDSVNGSDNIAIGFEAFKLNNASSCVAIGSRALNHASGDSNVSIGYQAMYANQPVVGCVAIGRQSLQFVGGNRNVAIGWATGNNTGLQGDQNTLVGTFAGYTTLQFGANNTVLGYNADTASSSSNNSVTLGDSRITDLRCATATITTISDARDKKDIAPIPFGLAFVNSLKPVNFTWNMRDGGKVDIKDSGFIAQDLQAAQVATPGSADYLKLVMDQNPDRLEASAGRLLPVLVKAIQELSARIVALEQQLSKV